MTATLIDGVVFTVEIGFSTTAGTNRVPLGSTLASINWTDVSAYVRGVSTNRGRSSELDAFQTGSASITFSNADRRFDPEYTAGPYYGALTPLRPVRIRAQYGAGATTNLFFGWIEQWPQQYQNPTDATVTVTASDGFKVLNLITLPSEWAYRVQTDTRVGYWLRMDDGTNTSVFDAYNNRKFGDYKTIAGAASAGVSGNSLIVNDDNPAAVFDGTKYIDGNIAGAVTAINFWMQTSTTTAGAYGIVTFPDNLPSCLGMDVTAGGVGTLRYTKTQTTFPGPNQAVSYTSTVQINDGKPHHIVLNVDDQEFPGDSLYIDGVRVTLTAGVSGDYTGPAAQFGIARPYVGSATSGTNFASAFIGTLDEFVVYAITSIPIVYVYATDVTTNYQIGVGTYLADQRTDQRISTVLTMAQWMTDGTDLNTGSGTVQAIATQNKTPLAVAQECETAEQGRLFIDRDGKIEFISRNALATTSIYNTSQYTFGDSTGELGYINLQFEFDDRLIFNRSVVSRNNGATATLNDTTSQGQYFIRTSSVTDLIVNTDQQIVDIANARLSAYAQPKLRIEQLTFTPRQAPATLYPVAIGVEIGTRITVNRRPQGVGAVISKQVIVEGISHTITPDGWQTTFNLSPVFVATFILDSATFGVLDSNQLGY